MLGGDKFDRQGLTRSRYLDCIVVIMNASSLGEFEQVTLLAILRLGNEAYGSAIRKEIKECTERDPTPGALYTTLDRLEAKGIVTSEFGDPTPQRGGRAKRFFRLTEKGRAAIVRAQLTYKTLLAGLDLLGGEHA
jgi:PadR family transcriptional regulator PadR